MMKQLKQKTNKLFFNKWPFKVECYLKGSSKVKYAKPWRIRMWANDDADMFSADYRFTGVGSYRREQIDKFELLKFTNAVEPFLDREDIKIRAEGAHFNLFCGNFAVKSDIVKALSPWIKDVVGPETQEELDFLVGNNLKVICNTLPHGKYKYKVVLKSWIENPDNKKKLLNYLVAMGEDKVKCSPETIRFLMDQTRYKQDPFFYLIEDKSLTFIRLLSNDIKHVYEYVERNSINTTLQ